jgi:hypothetical protein
MKTTQNEMEKMIFPLNPNEITTETHSSPPSLPHLIIRNQNRVLGSLSLN